MQDQIFDLISSWAKIPTWYTSHPQDERRFNEAITRLVETMGTDVKISDFKNALTKHAENTVPMLGMPDDFDEIINVYTEKAFKIINACRRATQVY